MSRPRTVGSGIFWPGSSVLHRRSVGVKLAGLLAGTTAIVWIDRAQVSVAVAGGVAALAWAGGVRLRAIGRVAAPVLAMVALVLLLQVSTGHGESGVDAAARLFAVGMLAVVFTLTTRSGAIAAWVERTLTRMRVPPRAVFRVGLMSGLVTRSFEHLGDVADRVLDARRARGLQRSARAFAVPMVVEAARLAHGMGEALDARGISDGAAIQETPRQPYRFVTGFVVGPDGAGKGVWVPTGGELGPAVRRAATVPLHLAAEAMAQGAGMLCAAHGATPGVRWVLAGIDDLRVDELAWDVPVVVRCRIDRRSSRATRVAVRVEQAGVEHGRAMMLMAPFTLPAATSR